MQRSALSRSCGRSLLLGASLLALFGACLPSFPDTSPGGASDPTPRVSGTVVDADGAALAQVVVMQEGREIGMSDASGRFEVTADAGDTVVLQFHKPGHVRGLERVQIADAPTALRVTLLDEAPAIAFDSDAGGKVTGMRGASIDAAPGSFVDRDGNAVSGMVDVHLTPLNPGVQAELAAYPGDGRARTADGATVQLETFGVVDVTVRQGDTDLTIADGMGVVVEFPLPDPMPAAPPATIALWGFDDATGEWTEEGVATLDAQRGVYVGTITHLSPWNCDQPLEATCVKGRVVDTSGDGIPGAYVIARGLDYSGDSAATAGEGGEFCVPVRKDSRVEVTVHLPGGEQQTREIDSGSEDTEVPVACDDPRCLDAGEWTFAEGAGDEDEWQGGEACFGEDVGAKLSMELAGAVQDDIQWEGSAWFASCGALSGSTGSGSTTLMFQDDAMQLGVMVNLEVDAAQTGADVVASVYLFEDWAVQTSGLWYAENCVADVTRNEVLGPGIFHVEGTGSCAEPAMSAYPGETGEIEIVGTFAFEGVVIGSDVASEVIYDCCIGYW